MCWNDAMTAAVDKALSVVTMKIILYESTVAAYSDHGSVLYLILLQICSYDQHNLLSMLQNNDTAVIKITVSIDLNNNPPLSNDNDNDNTTGAIYNRTSSSVDIAFTKTTSSSYEFNADTMTNILQSRRRIFYDLA